MITLIAGLVIFLGVHSVRIFAEPWRSSMLAKIGERRWKGMYAVVSLIGFAVLIWGYGMARRETTYLWTPPTGMRHLAALLVLIAFVLLAAAYGPANRIRGRLHHPMVLGVKAWALGHLFANGSVADIVLFGSFLVWAVLSFRAARQRDRRDGTVYPQGSTGATIATVVVGAVAWAIFAFWLHGLLIGVRPLG